MKKNCFIKRLTAIAVTSALIISSSAVLADASFTDLAGHWGKEYVDILINDGTITGYEDNTFRPDATVTRAEFVKMIGKSSVRFENDFDDVPKTHWGYDYVMYSELDGNGKLFNPDTPILRNDVVNLIWKRNGSDTSSFAPSIIKNQGSNQDAAAWAYANGLIIGDDGLNLRLGDTLTRAEASALIVRARKINESSQKKGFGETVSDTVLKAIYDALNLFDTPYLPDETFTNGEMARAVLRYGTRQHNLDSSYLYAKSLFEGEYSKDLYLIGKECIGLENVTKDFCNAKANIGNTLAELVYNSRKLVTKSIKIPAQSSYSDTDSLNDKILKQLSFANGYGIKLFSDNSINPSKEITKREFMALLIQLDEIIGSQLAYDLTTPSNVSISKEIDKYPANYDDFSCILKGIPNIVYTTKIGDKLPKECTGYATGIASSFREMLNEIEKKASLKGYTIKTTYYPTLVSETNNNVIIRVKMEFIAISNEPVSSFVTVSDSLSISPKIGDKYYFDIEIPPILDLYISSDDVKIINAIKE